MPGSAPKWQSVYYHFRVWSEKDETGASVLDKVLQKLVKQIRNEDLGQDKTTFGIVDAQSVQNADTAKRLWRREKISGIKRHVIVDTMGLPHAIAVTTADVTDRDGAIQKLRDTASGTDGFIGRDIPQDKVSPRQEISA